MRRSDIVILTVAILLFVVIWMLYIYLINKGNDKRYIKRDHYELALDYWQMPDDKSTVVIHCPDQKFPLYGTAVDWIAGEPELINLYRDEGILRIKIEPYTIIYIDE